MITLLAGIAYSQFGMTENKKEDKKLPWYGVEDWEADVCSKWGGRTTTDQSENSAAEETYGDIAMTLQARKIKSQNATLYEITYYLESASTTTPYKIKLVNQKTNAETEISAGTLNAENAVSEEKTETLKENYDLAIIEHSKGQINAPIIEVR